MECSVAEGMVSRYINNTLSPEELERFLDHVEGCPSCQEELETYYIVNKVTRQLDGDSSGVLDFRKLLAEDIRASRRCVLRHKVRRFWKGLGWLVLIGLLVAFLAFVIMEIRQFII